MELETMLFALIIAIAVIVLLGIFQEDSHETIKYKIKDIHKGRYVIAEGLELVVDKWEPWSRIILNGREAWTYLDDWIVYNEDIFKDFKRFHYLNKKNISNNHFNTVKSYKRQLK